MEKDNVYCDFGFVLLLKALRLTKSIFFNMTDYLPHYNVKWTRLKWATYLFHKLRQTSAYIGCEESYCLTCFWLMSWLAVHWMMNYLSFFIPISRYSFSFVTELPLKIHYTFSTIYRSYCYNVCSFELNMRTLSNLIHI